MGLSKDRSRVLKCQGERLEKPFVVGFSKHSGQALSDHEHVVLKSAEIFMSNICAFFILSIRLFLYTMIDNWQ